MSALDPAPTAPTLTADETARALDASSVVRWWQTTTLLEVAGPDAPTLLDGLCTQAVERILPGHAVLGLFLDAKAKIIAPALLHRLADAAWSDPRAGTVEPTAPRLALETLPELVEPLRAHLARYRLRARVTLEPSPLACIAIAGAVDDALQLPELGGEWTRTDARPWPIRTFLGEPDACGELVRELLPAAGVPLADPDAYEAARIEAGVASLHDLLPGRMPAEVGGMEHAVALDAGCYLGQEPVARLHYRGRANRTLRRLEGPDQVTFDETAATPQVDASPLELLVDADEDGAAARAVGRLTTWSTRRDGTTIALAMLRREITAGTRLRLAGGPTRLLPVDDAPA